MPTFVGRAPELSRARAAALRALSGDGGLVLFSGEPGIGKTTLAEQTAALAREQGASVVWGRAWEAGGAPAYWPWIQVFRAIGADDPFTTSTTDSPADAQQARFRVFDVAVERLKQAARDRPLAVLLDDLHAADVPSLFLLHLLSRGLRGTPLLVIGTYREVEARLASDVSALLAKIAREGEVIPVARLTPEEVGEWVRRESPSARAATADQVYRVTEGNPLFVEEVLRLGGALDPVRIPDGLKAALDEHVARVSPETRALLEAAAVLGREFTPRALGVIAGAGADTLDARLREATTAGIVSPGGAGHFVFGHMLLRDRLYAELAPSRRAELHWRAGESIIAEHGDLSSAAHHLLEGHTAGDVGRALAVAREGAANAMARLAFEDAVRIGEKALGAFAGRPPTREACEALIVVAEALMHCGESARGKDTCRRARSLADELDAPDLVARAALAYATHLVSAVVDPEMVALLREALARLPTGDDALRARVMARLGAALVPPRDEAAVPEVLELARESRAMARRIGDAQTLLYTLRFAASAAGYLVGSDERFAMGEEILDLARAAGDRQTLINVGGWHIASLLETGRRADADAALDAFTRLLEESPQPYYQWRLPILRAAFAAFEGDLDLAARLGDDALAIAEGAGVGSGRVAWALQRIALAQARGDATSIQVDAHRVLEVIGRIPTLIPYSAWVLAATGRTEEALVGLRSVGKTLQSFPWLIIACDACVIVGNTELAAIFEPALAGHAFKQRAFWGPAGAFMLGPTSRTLGDLALLLGEADQALAHYDDAIAMCKRIGARPLLALSRRGREQAVLRRGGADHAPKSDAARPLRAGTGVRFTLQRDGDIWSLVRPDCSPVLLKDAKGLSYLEKLLQNPTRDVHVFDLIGTDEAPGDAGPALDSKAKEEYRRRLENLRNQLEEAESFGDVARAGRAQEEIDAIAEQLAGAVGLGGRDRRAASNVERARINVQRRLKDAIDRIAAQDADLGRYLGATVKTGTYCSFSPL